MAHKRWKGLQYYELIACITGQDAFNAQLRCPLALLGTGTRPVPSVAALPRFDMRPGQQCVQRHEGRQAAEVARWQGLHKELHATTEVLAELVWKPHVATQVPAQLVGLAGGCERRRSLGWCGPDRGPADALGKGLAVALRSSPPRHLPGVFWIPSARITPRVSVFWSSSDLTCL